MNARNAWKKTARVGGLSAAALLAAAASASPVDGPGKGNDRGGSGSGGHGAPPARSVQTQSAPPMRVQSAPPARQSVPTFAGSRSAPPQMASPRFAPPAVTRAPAVSQTPAVSRAPAITRAPEVTSRPQVVDGPRATQQQVIRAGPKGDARPGVTSGVASKPPVLIAPPSGGITQKPAVTAPPASGKPTGLIGTTGALQKPVLIAPPASGKPAIVGGISAQKPGGAGTITQGVVTAPPLTTKPATTWAGGAVQKPGSGAGTTQTLATTAPAGFVPPRGGERRSGGRAFDKPLQSDPAPVRTAAAADSRSGHDRDWRGRNWDGGHGDRHDWNRRDWNGRDWNRHDWERAHHRSSGVFLGLGFGFGFGGGSVFFSEGFPVHRHWDPFWWGWRDPWCSPWWVHRPLVCATPVVVYDPCWRPVVVGSDPFFCTTVLADTCAVRSCDPVLSRCEIISVPVCDTGPIWAVSTNSVYRYTTVTPPVVLQPTVVTSPAPVVASETLPAPSREAELRASSDRELGDTYLRLRDPDNAARVYQQHLAKHPGDAQAVRSLGVAQIVGGRVSEGVDQIERAYRIDPSLADRPLTREAFGDPAEFTRALDLATRMASSSNTAGGWLAAAVMLQADGRSGPARGAIENAKAAGLDPVVVDGMKGVLPDAPAQPPQ